MFNIPDAMPVNELSFVQEKVTAKTSENPFLNERFNHRRKVVRRAVSRGVRLKAVSARMPIVSRV